MANVYTYQQAIAKISAQGLRGMSSEDLKAVGAPLMQVVKARIYRLRKAGLTETPAYIGYVTDKGMKASVKSNKRSELLSEVYEAYQFLTMAKTSTVRGAKESIANMERLLGAKLSREQIGKIWDVYHRIEKENPYAFQKFGYDQIIGIASRNTKEQGYDVDAALEMANMELDFFDRNPYGENEEYEDITESEWSDIWGSDL